MTKSPEILMKQIVELLSLLPGVEVLDSIATNDLFRITLTVSDPSSRLLLTYCSEGANVIFMSWAQFKPGSPEAKKEPEKAIQYSFRCSKSKESNCDPLHNLGNLGAHLVWQMYGTSIINAAQEKEFAKQFNAVSKNA